ncbi:ankyrin repeat domain-containing protein [Luteolibacter soli]|uniref:Ankyrin repeat domain-containing protein n=1 Tax=Luteolibacter soli TaxID=3135280 RepID=A0ABU9B3C1_9BACT
MEPTSVLLIEAAFRGDMEAVESLLSEGARVDAEDKGLTPLHAAIENGQTEVVRRLLEVGADIEAISLAGTPLAHAVDLVIDTALQSGTPVERESTEVIDLLIAAGANIEAGLEVARDYGCAFIEEHLMRRKREVKEASIGMLLEKLNQEFSDISYPGDDQLADSYPNEWEATLDNLCGKDWRDVEAKDFDSQGGVIEGIQALGSKGFLYFLPGLVRIFLTDPVSRYSVGYGLLTWFTVPEGIKPDDSQIVVLHALPSARRDFMVRFFGVFRILEPDLSPAIVDAAIVSLRAGVVTAYRFVR